MTDKFAFYIHSDVFKLDNFSKERFTEFRKQIEPLIEVGRQLEADIYYANEDINQIQSDFEEFDGYIQNDRNYLSVLLEQTIKNEETNYFFRLIFNESQSSIESITLKGLHSICTQKAYNILFSLNNIGQDYLLKVTSNTDFEKIVVNIFSSKYDIWEFINKQLPKRVYQFSPKHGNNTKKANPPKSNEKVSQLKCSDDEAQLLLDTAIFDLREHKWCYNFDCKLGTFIVFPFEGENPQNQFHAFHLEESEWNKVSTSIRKFFDK